MNPKQKSIKTDFKKLKKMSDEDIDYSDSPATTKKFWEDAVIVMPAKKKHISLRLDEDIIKFFKKDGDSYQSKINAVLKTYIVHMQSRKKFPKSKAA